MAMNSERKGRHKNVHRNTSKLTPPTSATSTAKPEFSREELRAISQEVAEKFPIPTETTELVLMDVDPHHVHAYWNIAPEDLAAFDTTPDDLAGESNLVLRFHDLSPPQPGSSRRREPFDIPVRGQENHWYVELWHDAKSYEAELGLRMQDGGLVTLARSKPVQTPQAGESPEFGAPQITPGQVNWPSRSYMSDVSPDGTVPPTTEPALAQVFPNISANDEQAVRQGPRAGGVPADPSLTASGPWAATPEPYPVRIHGPVLTGTPREGRWAGSTSPSMQAGSYSYSSSSLTRSSGFELHAELHIYGQGIPGDRVQLFGQPVVVGADGHFSLWRPLEGPTGIGTFTSESEDRGAQDGDG